METTVNVSGMTCSHCVASVTEELTALDGIETVEIDLSPGGISRAVITSTRSVDPAEISQAVAEAGYAVVPTGA